MRVLWAPWRLCYVERAPADSGCIFCRFPGIRDGRQRREALVLKVTEHATVVMNRYPYSNAHLLVSPTQHTADFAGLDEESASGLQAEVQAAVGVLDRAYAPGGFNVGMNLGVAGGAGIAEHLHWHIVPRWQGDTNFMPMLADTRVIPEHLEAAYDKLLPMFEEG